MSLITFDFACKACGNVEERRVKRDSLDDQTCTICEGKMARRMAAPRLDIAGMARAGCPGAYETIGNDLEKRHRKVDQHHRKAG